MDIALTKRRRNVDVRPFNILSICSGGGGLDLGVRLACRNSYTQCYVEIEAYACEILASRMEEGALCEAPVWSNIKTFDGKPWRGKVDCIIGGYPCQPWSYAGQRKGKDDPRHLWPHIARIIREVEPGYCFFENVAGHLSLGFDDVSAELREMGYEIEAGLFSASEVGASHIRKRLFVLAARKECVQSMADACRERRQQITGSAYANEGEHERWAKDEGDQPERPNQDASGTMAAAICPKGDDYEILADPAKRGKRERLGKQKKAAARGESGTEGHGEELAHANGIRPLDVKQSTQGRSTEPTPEHSRGILPPHGREEMVNAEGVAEREPNDEACSVPRGESRTYLGWGCGDVVDPEGLRGEEVKWLEQDGLLQEVASYGGIALENGPIPLFPPGPDDSNGWWQALCVESSVEPKICNLVDELAIGLGGGPDGNRIDQLRLLGNGVVPTCAAYAFGILFVKHVNRFESAN
jgi:DNA (cytosine-5)-methyltransferase 1